MSHENNSLIIEKAYELLEETTGTWMEKAIQGAIDRNDLDELYDLINRIEAELAIEHFHNADILEHGDEF